MMVTSVKTGRERLDLCGAPGDWRVAWSADTLRGIKTAAEAEDNGLVFHNCAVPGCIENDLYELGVIPDPFFGMNALKANAYAERLHVFYTRRFEYAPAWGFEAFLVFEGLDCFAEIYINGALAAETGNMLIEHRISAGGFLIDGENELFVHIRPARAEALKYDYPQLLDGLPVNMESLYVRKAAHMYGWDICPRFVSAGIFRPVYIERAPAERFVETYLKTAEISGDKTKAKLSLHYKFMGDLDASYQIRFEMACGDSQFMKTMNPPFIAGKLNFVIDAPMLWSPKGRGPAHLYDVRVRLYRDGVCVDDARFTHGIRTTELVRTALTNSAMEGEFVFKINGEKIFAKGTNWVPADAFHFRDAGRIPAMLDLANDLNCNMIRCWGGNVYENEVFYDICDASGILVWQDFSMACAVYPQDAAFQAQLAAEAEAVVKRLRTHPCVVLWAGDNECDQAHQWGYSKTDPDTNVLTRRVLPEAVRVHDGSRPYICSSPFLDKGTLGSERFVSEAHLWGPRNYFKSGYYMNALCHFVSEVGYHGCPSPESVAKFISKDKLWPWRDNDEWTLHASSPAPGIYDYRVELMAKQITELFAETPDNLADFAFASQAVQAEAKKFFIEMFRMGKWKRTGILWWNLIDGWPQFSDAVTDYYFNKKLAYGFIKNAQQDICVMVGEPDGWDQAVVLVNDTCADAEVNCEITNVETGEMVFNGAFTAKTDSAEIIGNMPYKRNKRRMFLISWTGGAEGKNHYLSGQPPFELEEYRRLLKLTGLY